MDETDKVILGNGRFGKTPSIVRSRRNTVPIKPNYPLNLWSIMKNCIGKELSKIPMPVNFNEPLSMLQRLVFLFENYRYDRRRKINNILILDLQRTMSTQIY